jgi:hypothetical protein
MADRKLEEQPLQHVITSQTMQTRLPFYWWFRGKYLSDLPDSLIPETEDVLEKLAWASIKYDHLGGPNTKQVVLTYLKPDRVENPNKSWDMSRNVSGIMKRVFQYDGLLNFVTIILHIMVLLPMSFNGVSRRDIFTRFLKTIEK